MGGWFLACCLDLQVAQGGAEIDGELVFFVDLVIGLERRRIG